MANLYFDNESLLEFTESFFKATEIQIGIQNTEHSDFIWYHLQDRCFCYNCGERFAKFKDRCKRSDSEACEMVEHKGKTYIYKCFMGFEEALIPYISDGETLFCFFIGRVVENLMSETEFAKKMIDFGADETLIPELYGEYLKTPIVTGERFRGAVKLLEECSQMMYQLNLINKRIMTSFERFKDASDKNDFVNVDEAAKALGISPSQLSRVIKKNTGDTFSMYINRKRIEKAKKMLLNTKYKITEISEMTGFSDPNYFARLFKKFVGMTAGEYRLDGKD